MAKADTDFAKPIINAAAEVAKVVSARVMFAYADAVRDLPALQEIVQPPTKLIVVCRTPEDEQRAREQAEKWMTRYWKTVLDHYDFGKPDRFEGIKGYENYVDQAQGIVDAGEEAIAEDFMRVQTWGTPKTCLDKITHIYEQVGCEQLIGIFRFADMPFSEGERNLRTFADTVLPELKKLPSRA